MAYSSFSQCWSAIQAVPVGASIKPWSAAGRAKPTSAFVISAMNASAVDVQPSNGALRHVTKGDFAYIFNLWPSYKAGTLRRDQLNRSQNTTYILSILRHVGA
jgi:hypothetical protein